MAERRRHTKDYGALKKTVSDNIQRLMNQQKEYGGKIQTHDDLAEELDVAVSTVHRWYTGAVLPSADYLVAIAGVFGVSVNDLLNKGGIQEHPAENITYSQLLRIILDLETESYFFREGFGDPFIRYLYDRFVTIEQTPTIQQDRKDMWKQKVYRDYDRPLLPVYLTQYIELFRWQFSEIEEYDTYLAVFNVMQDYMNGKGKSVIDDLIAQWHKDDDARGGRFPGINVPWLSGSGHPSIIYKAQKRNPRRSKYDFDLSERRKDMHGEAALPDETDVLG